MPSLGIEYSTTRHELQRRISARAVHELVRKILLLVKALTNDRKHQLASVGQGDVHSIPELQFIDVVKNRRTVVVVNVTQNDRRTLLAG